MGELTGIEGGGVHHGDEEGDDEKLQLEHGDVWGFMTLEEPTLGFIQFSPFSCEDKKPGFGLALPCTPLPQSSVSVSSSSEYSPETSSRFIPVLPSSSVFFPCLRL